MVLAPSQVVVLGVLSINSNYRCGGQQVVPRSRTQWNPGSQAVCDRLWGKQVHLSEDHTLWKHPKESSKLLCSIFTPFRNHRTTRIIESSQGHLGNPTSCRLRVIPILIPESIIKDVVTSAACNDLNKMTCNDYGQQPARLFGFPSEKHDIHTIILPTKKCEKCDSIRKSQGSIAVDLCFFEINTLDEAMRLDSDHHQQSTIQPTSVEKKHNCTANTNRLTHLTSCSCGTYTIFV